MASKVGQLIAESGVVGGVEEELGYGEVGLVQFGGQKLPVGGPVG